MLKISFDNPFIIPLAFIFFGLIGYLYYIEMYSDFDVIFVFLMSLLFLFFLFVAEYLERKKFPSRVNVDPFFCWSVILLKSYLLFLVVLSGPANHFDDRLSIFGSSFVLGVDNALAIFLFPLIPALTKDKYIFWTSMAVWILGVSISVVYAPSKSFFIGFIFSILFFRFLRRKVYRDRSPLSIFSLKSMTLAFLAIALTFGLVYSQYGSSALSVIVHRAAYNYDIAIYISSVYPESTPDHGVLYYAILPLLKQFDSSLYSLQFFSIPQWAVYEALGIERFGRFGYPNDNFAAGLIASYGYLGIPIFIFSLLFWLSFICFLLSKRSVGLMSLFLIFSMPLFYSSLQDFSIYFLVAFNLYAFFYLSSCLFRGLAIPLHARSI